MKRVLIVDDDVLVCRFVSQIIDWNLHGYELAGIARDGAQALTMISELDPHILITDIEMPVMNGIQLLKQLRQSEKRAKILILSCHDDFEYVKEAMRLGADEYFLKDELTGEKLLEILQKFSEELDESQGEEEKRENKVADELEEKQLLQLLDGTALQIPGFHPELIAAVRVSDNEDTITIRSLEQREEFYRSFVSILKEQIARKGRGKACHVKAGWFAVFPEFEKGTGRQEQQYRFQELANAILHQTNKHFELKISIGVAELVDCGGEPAAAWERAKELLGYSFYERNQIFSSWQYGPMGETMPQSAADFLNKAGEWKVKRDQALIRSAAEIALQAFRMAKTKESVVAYWLRVADGIFKIPARPAPRQFELMKDVGKEYAAACEQYISDNGQYSDSVADVLRYIQQNYRNNITLQAAANAVHLTPAYLSYIFHKETDVTFSDYLQNCRIGHAKELLVGTRDSIREIADLVGYNDYRHFSKVFKKMTGMTPQEYRRYGHN